MDPDMVFSNSLGLDVTVATGGSPDPEYLCGLRWQHGPWMSTQTLVGVGPWT